MINFFKLSGAASLAFALNMSAYSAVPLYTVNIGLNGAGTFGSFDTLVTVTQNFNLTENYNVTALGLLDYGFQPYGYQPPNPTTNDLYKISNLGFNGSHSVALLKAGSTVAQTTFAAGLTGYIGPGTLDFDNTLPDLNLAQFRYLDITPVALTPGQYSLVSTWKGNDRDGYQIRTLNEGYTAAPGVTMGNVSVVYPDIFTAPAGFVGNLLLQSPVVSPVPEPSEVAMMLFGLGVVAAISRRRKALVPLT
jgi:hypothetical protein